MICIKKIAKNNFKKIKLSLLTTFGRHKVKENDSNAT